MLARPNAQSGPSVSAAALFVLVCVWVAVSLAGGRLAGTLVPAPWFDLVRQAVALVLLFCGFYGMAKFGVHDLRPLSSLGFVQRPTAREELGRGLALGWGIALVLVAPAILTGATALHWEWSGGTLLRLVAGAANLLLCALLVQLVLSGLPVRLLVRTAGPAWTFLSILLVVVVLALSLLPWQGTGLLFILVAAALFTWAFLRTRAVWFSLGLQTGWTVALQLLFGASSPYTPLASGPVTSDTSGPRWLTGNVFGPETSSLAVPVLIVAIPILFRLTRTYAWHYTYQAPVAGGYSMNVKPPAAHAEQQTAAVAPLIQIGGIAVATTPASETSQKQT